MLRVNPTAGHLCNPTGVVDRILQCSSPVGGYRGRVAREVIRVGHVDTPAGAAVHRRAN
jgi:hypothetical protein